MTIHDSLGILCALVASCAACLDLGGDGELPDQQLISGADGSDPAKVPGGDGGYWWSYQDIAGSWVEPSSDREHPFSFALAGHRKRAARISYEILAAPDDDAVGTTWRYRDSSGSYAYPTGGVGLSFKKANGILDIPKTKLGIKFWAKGTGASVDPGITVEFPTADTDVALDGDQFTTSCTCGMREGKLCLPAHGALETDNVKKPEMHTCFANFYYRLELTSEWQQYVVLFKDLKWADDGEEWPWVDRSKLTHKVDDTDDPVGWDRSKALKVQFAAYRPPARDEPARGEMWIDEVAWVIAADHIDESGPR